MYNIYKAIQHRMQKFLMAEATLTANASAGDGSITVDDATLFDFEGLNGHVPTVILMDNNTTGKRLGSGYAGAELIDVSSVDTDTNIITFSTNLQRNWLTSATSVVMRAPGSTVVKKVVIGDLAVIKQFPTICVVPTNETLDWFTMPGGTRETVTIDFMIYAEEGDTETATEEVLRLTEVVKWILMSNLHIQERNADSVYAVTSKAMVSNIDYGMIQKGSEFLKAVKLTWTGELYMQRDYMYSNATALYTGQ